MSTFFLSISPLLPSIASSMEAPLPATGLVATLYTAGFAASTLTAAFCSDRASPAKLLIVAGLIHCVALICASGAATLFQLQAAYLVAGLAAGVLQPTAYRAALQLAPAGGRGKWLGALTAGWAVATVLGAPLLAWLSPTVGWRLLLVLLALLWVPVLAALKPISTSPGRTAHPHAGPGLAPEALLICFATAVAGAGFHGTFPLLGAALTTASPTSSLSSEAVFLCFGIGAFAASCALGRVSRALPEYVYLVCVVFTCSIYGLLPTALASGWFTVALMLLWGFAQTLGFAMLLLAIARRSESRLGLATGLSGACMMGGAALGSAAGLAAFGGGGFALLCVLGGVLTAISAIPVGLLVAGRQPGERATALEMTDSRRPEG